MNKTEEILENLNELTSEMFSDSIETMLKSFIAVNMLITEYIENEEFEKAAKLRDVRDKRSIEFHDRLSLFYAAFNNQIADIVDDKELLRPLSLTLPDKDLISNFIKYQKNQYIIDAFITFSNMMNEIEQTGDFEKYDDYAKILHNEILDIRDYYVEEKTNGHKKSKFFED